MSEVNSLFRNGKGKNRGHLGTTISSRENICSLVIQIENKNTIEKI